MFTKSTVSQSMIDAVNSILEEEKKIQQLDEASAFDWKANKNETDPKFTTKKPGERTGHESKKTATGTMYTKKPLRSDGQEFKKEETEISFKERLLEKNWIAGAIKKPGSMTAAAKRAGESTSEYEQKHKHDSGKAGQRARLAITLSKLKKEEATFDELLEDLNDAQVDKLIFEVLGKDADAGDYIHDFIHSKNPKFAGKSKEMRKKMALGAYYGKHNEEVKDEYARKVDKYLKKKYNKEEVELHEETMKDCYDCGVREAKKEMKTGVARKSKYEKGTPEYKESLRGYKSVMKNEEVEQIDELSKSTLSSYLDKKKSEYMQGKTQSGSKENARDIQNMGKAHDKIKKEELIGGQKKIDKNHNGKIDAQDFQILRGQKKSQKNEGVMNVVKKAGTKALHVLGHGSDEDMKKDLQKKMGISQKEVSTDTLAGRVQGGAPNQHSSHKIALKAESVDKDKPPFDGPYTKAKGNIKDKSGAIHTPMSRARDLAKTAMKKVKTEMLGKTGTSE
jgi:hypothetical protein